MTLGLRREMVGFGTVLGRPISLMWVACICKGNGEATVDVRLGSTVHIVVACKATAIYSRARGITPAQMGRIEAFVWV